MKPEDIEISLYRHSVPDFVEVETERLYQHMYASASHLEACGAIDGRTNTYVVRIDGVVRVVLLFLIEGKQVRVLNEQIRIDKEEVDRFAKAVFSTFDFVNLISFPVIEGKISRLSFPYQQFHCTQDIVLSLPSTSRKYFDRLGKATRNYIKRYQARLERCHPSVQFQVYQKDEASEQQVRDIIALNRARMAVRHKASYIDEAEAERIVKLTMARGMIGVMTIDGKICAGTINYRFGDNYFLKVVAHDPRYDAHGLGTLCCYHTICACIDRNGREYHFLWGQYEYKYRLLGVQHDLDHCTIYRSRRHLLQNGRTAIRIAYAGAVYQARSWLLNKARREDHSNLPSILAYRFLNGLRKLKRFAAGLHAAHKGL